MFLWCAGVEVPECAWLPATFSDGEWAHFSLWCVTSAPLYLGMKLDNLSAADLAIVSNRAAIVRYSCALYFAASL